MATKRKTVSRHPVMTYSLAMAAGRDAANRAMRKAGRTKWSKADYNAAVKEFDRLWPSPNPAQLAKRNSGTMFGPHTVAKAKKVRKVARVKDQESGAEGTVIQMAKGAMKIVWDDGTETVGGVRRKNPTAGSDSSVRSPTSTSTEVRSPTATSTKAHTAGNVTVTGGAGAGANTKVVIVKKNPLVKFRTSAGYDGWKAGPIRITDNGDSWRVTSATGKLGLYHKNHYKTPAAALAHYRKHGVVNPKPKGKAAAHFEEFHGRPATKTVSVDISAQARKEPISAIGKLVQLKIKGVGVRKGAPGMFLAADKRKRLWLVGGKIGKAKPGTKAGALEKVGEIEHVIYRANKVHINPGMTDYIHKLGEESGAKPTLFIDAQGYGVIKGGEYTINERGIIN